MNGTQPERPPLTEVRPAPRAAGVEPRARAVGTLTVLGTLAGAVALVLAFLHRTEHVTDLRGIMAVQLPDQTVQDRDAASALIYLLAMIAYGLVTLAQAFAATLLPADRLLKRWILSLLMPWDLIVAIVLAAIVTNGDQAPLYVILIGAQLLSATIVLIVAFLPHRRTATSDR